LIWICSALARYSAVTPNRPEATCLIFDFSTSPSLSSMFLCDPVRASRGAQRFARLDGREAPAVLAAFAGVRFAATRFIATASVVCASIEIEPCDIAPVEKTLDDLGGGLDFFDRNGFYVAEAKLEQPAEGHVSLRLVVDDGAVFPVGLRGVLPRDCCISDRVRRPHVLLAATRQAYSPPLQHRFQHRVVLVETRPCGCGSPLRNLENIYAPDR